MKAAVRLVASLALGLGAATSCGVRGLSFVSDDEFRIVRPSDNATVQLPLTLNWVAADFDGRFAVFFDRSPIRRKLHLRSLVPDDDPCRFDRACPDAEWLADRHIYVTGDTHLTVEWLPDRRTNDWSKDRHYVTVVLIDDNGRRTGETAVTREFILERKQ